MSASSSSSSDDGKSTNRISKCLRNISNMSYVTPVMLMDTKVFNADVLKFSIPKSAPKIERLFKQIKKLDEKDMKQHGKLFKHIIFTDVNSNNYGAKLIASAFVAYDYKPAFNNSLSLKSDNELQESNGNNFGLLISKPFAKKSMNLKAKKAMMLKYNERPNNVHGDLMRFIILDQGFKEGIDLFDVKYVHLFEPLVSLADEKQAIGRGTRFCGQKGLEFHPRFGWPLYVFRYDVLLGDIVPDAKTLFELYLKHLEIDLRKVVFAAEIEKATIDAAIDRELTSEIHMFKINNPSPILSGKKISGGAISPFPPRRVMKVVDAHRYISKNFSQYKYPKVKLENLCNDNKIQFTPSQEFIRHYFQPSSAYKGILLYHSVGTGKTCTAIATATTSFEKMGYNIMWITRHTLKSDIWKNMFSQVCSLTVQEGLKDGSLKLPKGGIKSGYMRYVSDRWIEPISYKQFSNLLLQKNKFYDEMIERNGKIDPLKKTLLIIDEAHKLYAENVNASEKPKIEVLESWIQNSYEKSGKDSVRVMLMTATPFTSDGIELVKLLNLLRPKKDHIPSDFDKFGKEYLDNNGYFSKTGLKKYQDQISGYVSYLNRSQDARNFAHPVIENIYTDISRKTVDKELPEKHIDKGIKDITQRVKELRAEIKIEKESLKDKISEVKTKCAAEQKKRIDDCKKDVKTKYENDINKAKEQKENAVHECANVPKKDKKACKEAANDVYKATVEKVKNTKVIGNKECIELKTECALEKKGRVGALNNKIDELKKLIDEINNNKVQNKDIIKDVMLNTKEINQKLKELRGEIAIMRENIREVTSEVKELRAKSKSEKNKEKRMELLVKIKELNKSIKEMKVPYDEKKVIMTNLKTKKVMEKVKVGRAIINAKSQEEALFNKCLKDS